MPPLTCCCFHLAGNQETDDSFYSLLLIEKAKSEGREEEGDSGTESGDMAAEDKKEARATRVGTGGARGLYSQERGTPIRLLQAPSESLSSGARTRVSTRALGTLGKSLHILSLQVHTCEAGVTVHMLQARGGDEIV